MKVSLGEATKETEPAQYAGRDATFAARCGSCGNEERPSSGQKIAEAHVWPFSGAGVMNTTETPD